MNTVTLLMILLCSGQGANTTCIPSVTVLDSMRQCESAGRWIEATARTANKALRVVWNCQENAR